MTFLEAAVEVLREAGRPLHFKKIADAALKRDLLSHSGKTPDDAMRARLEAEARRGGPGVVVEEVRPGIFGIKAGADLDDSRQTITLHDPALDEMPEPEPVVAEEALAADVADSEPAPAPQVANPAGNGGDESRRRRRGRRGGRRRPEGGAPAGDEDADAAEGDDDGDDDGDIDAAPAPAPAPAPSERNHQRHVEARAERPAPAGPAVRDIAAAAVDIFRRRNDGSPLSASRVAEELARAGVGALGTLGTSALRATLSEANARRARDGRPPVFEETKPNFWSLAAASGSSLARSYAALDQWQARHRAALVDTLVERLTSAPEAALGTVVTLLLDRTGHTDITAHSGAQLTLSARSPRGLTTATVAIRVFPTGRAVSAESVAAFRGSLHAFQATEGVILAFGAVEDSAQTESAVPNLAPISILDVREVANRLIGAGVGVARFSVDVSCLDDAFLRDVRG
ncbi:MAG: winged helix-turn-helix domain-containing protein [Myxococcales bacterium]|nr:winged helix-turn-helix domain-containing protein [Myxococcales bacterium]MCB9531669.1 winged helix-turn-helix domain-containing protein [Myxococcales bacterium]